MTNNQLSLRIKLSRPDFELAINTTVPLSGVTAIFGRSGCGKTTLLRAISGLEKQLQGQIYFGEQCWLDDSSAHKKQHCPVAERHIALVSQHDTLLPHLTVEENLLFGFKRQHLARRKLQPDEVYQRLALTPLLKRNVQQLSGGQKQRVALGRALLAQPQLLLLDEPFSALDLQGRQEILPYLQQLLADIEIPVLLVSHQLEDVVQLADQLLLLEHGSIKAQGPLALLLHSEAQLQNEALSLLYGKLQPSEPAPDCYCAVLLATETVFLPRNNSQADNSGHNMAHNRSKHRDKCRLRVRAKDVSVSLKPLQQSSIQLQLPAIISHWQSGPQPTDLLLYLTLADGQQLCAQISQLAFRQLNLQTGTTLYANIKAAALS